MIDFLVVERINGSASVFATSVGKGFILIDYTGRPVGEPIGYHEAIEGWTKMHFRSNMVDAFTDIGQPLPCPCCGSSALTQGLVVSMGNGLLYGVLCNSCGHEIRSQTKQEVVACWNLEYEHSQKLSKNTQKTTEKGL